MFLVLFPRKQWKKDEESDQRRKQPVASIKVQYPIHSGTATSHLPLKVPSSEDFSYSLFSCFSPCLHSVRRSPLFSCFSLCLYSIKRIHGVHHRNQEIPWTPQGSHKNPTYDHCTWGLSHTPNTNSLCFISQRGRRPRTGPFFNSTSTSTSSSTHQERLHQHSLPFSLLHHSLFCSCYFQEHHHPPPYSWDCS